MQREKSVHIWETPERLNIKLKINADMFLVVQQILHMSFCGGKKTFLFDHAEENCPQLVFPLPGKHLLFFIRNSWLSTMSYRTLKNYRNSTKSFAEILHENKKLLGNRSRKHSVIKSLFFLKDKSIIIAHTTIKSKSCVENFNGAFSSLLF